MCLLTFFPAGVLPDIEALLNGAVINNDGHGFAIATRDRLIVQRNLNDVALVEAFEVARRQHPGGPALFHSRFGTHGTDGLGNCHPFPVGGDSRTVLAHNGVLPSVVRPGKGDVRSDTRITAEDFLPVFGSLRTRRARTRLERWMTPENKMVILTVDPRFRKQAFILNESAGIWEGEIWYSNDGYLPAAVQARWGPDWLWDDGTDWDTQWYEMRPERCEHCGTLVDFSQQEECHRCGWCFYCDEMSDRCDCYLPAALDRRFGSASGM